MPTPRGERNLVEEIDYGCRWLLKEDRLPEELDHLDSASVFGYVFYPVAEAMRRTCKTAEDVVAMAESLTKRLSERVFHSDYFARKPFDFHEGGLSAYLDVSGQLIAKMGLPKVEDHLRVDPLVVATVYDLVMGQFSALIGGYLNGDIRTVGGHRTERVLACSVDGVVRQVELPFSFFANFLPEKVRLEGTKKDGRLVFWDAESRSAVGGFMESAAFEQMFDFLERGPAQSDPVAKLGANNIESVMIVEGRSYANYVTGPTEKRGGILIQEIPGNAVDHLACLAYLHHQMTATMWMMGGEVMYRRAGTAVNIFVVEALAELMGYAPQLMADDEELRLAARDVVSYILSYFVSVDGAAVLLSSYKMLEHKLNRYPLDVNLWRMVAAEVVAWAKEQRGLADFVFETSDVKTYDRMMSLADQYSPQSQQRVLVAKG